MSAEKTKTTFWSVTVPAVVGGICLLTLLILGPSEPRPRITNVIEMSDCNSPEQVRRVYGIVYPQMLSDKLSDRFTKTVLALGLCNGEVLYVGQTAPDPLSIMLKATVGSSPLTPSPFKDLEKSTHTIAVSE